MRVLDLEWQAGEGAEPLALLHVEMSQRYRHAFGSNSEFYAGLRDGVLRATRCETCQASWFPPRPRCDTDLERTIWYDLPGTGRVVAATMVHSAPPFGGVDVPYVLAVIQLDGVDGGITHRIVGSVPPEAGAEVAVTFTDKEPTHPLLSFAFQEGAA